MNIYRLVAEPLTKGWLFSVIGRCRGMFIPANPYKTTYYTLVLLRIYCMYMYYLIYLLSNLIVTMALSTVVSLRTKNHTKTMPRQVVSPTHQCRDGRGFPDDPFKARLIIKVAVYRMYWLDKNFSH